jgi:hypothetical protein
VETKEAREKPVKNRTRRKPVAELIMDEQYTAGVVSRIREADASLINVHLGYKYMKIVPIRTYLQCENHSYTFP